MNYNKIKMKYLPKIVNLSTKYVGIEALLSLSTLTLGLLIYENNFRSKPTLLIKNVPIESKDNKYEKESNVYVGIVPLNTANVEIKDIKHNNLSCLENKGYVILKQIHSEYPIIHESLIRIRYAKR